MIKIKWLHPNLNAARIIFEATALPVALFLLLQQLWGLIMREGEFPKDFWKVMPMDIIAAPELYAFGFTVLGFWAWLRLHSYHHNQEKEKPREGREAQIAATLETIQKQGEVILDRLDKEKPN